MRYIIVIILMLLLISCNQYKRQVNEISRIEFARSGAWADPGAEISIDNDLSYNYYGQLNTNRYRDTDFKLSYYSRKVSASFWDTLNARLERMNFKTIVTANDMSVKDAEYFELIIYWKGKKTRMVEMEDDTSKSDKILNIMERLNNLYKTTELHKVKNAFKFETSLLSPIPNIKQVKFPPPIKRGQNY